MKFVMYLENEYAQVTMDLLKCHTFVLFEFESTVT